jgi:hypothetical protein
MELAAVDLIEERRTGDVLAQNTRDRIAANPHEGIAGIDSVEAIGD